MREEGSEKVDETITQKEYDDGGKTTDSNYNYLYVYF